MSANSRAKLAKGPFSASGCPCSLPTRGGMRMVDAGLGMLCRYTNGKKRGPIIAQACSPSTEAARRAAERAVSAGILGRRLTSACLRRRGADHYGVYRAGTGGEYLVQQPLQMLRRLRLSARSSGVCSKLSVVSGTSPRRGWRFPMPPVLLDASFDGVTAGDTGVPAALLGAVVPACACTLSMLPSDNAMTQMAAAIPERYPAPANRDTRSPELRNREIQKREMIVSPYMSHLHFQQSE